MVVVRRQKKRARRELYYTLPGSDGQAKLSCGNALALSAIKSTATCTPFLASRILFLHRRARLSSFGIVYSENLFVLPTIFYFSLSALVSDDDVIKEIHDKSSERQLTEPLFFIQRKFSSLFNVVVVVFIFD